MITVSVIMITLAVIMITLTVIMIVMERYHGAVITLRSVITAP